MEISEIRKPNKYVVLATYLIAVVCLLLGLFLPLFNDKGILALQLPDVFNHLANKTADVKKPFTMPFQILLFGSAKLSVDIMAWVVALYTVITVVAVLALIPIGISTKKESRVATVCMFIVEAAATVILSIYLILALQLAEEYDVGYNMIIALCGSAVMLAVLSIMCKRGTGVIKVVLFLLSAIALLMLFDWFIFEKLATPLGKIYDKLKIVPAISGMTDGENIGYTDAISYLTLLFTSPYGDELKFMPDAKHKALMVMLTIVALIVVINYLIDVVSLATNGKKTGYVFNLARYALAFVAVLCLVIVILVAKYKLGLMLFVVIVAVLAQLLISLARFLIYRKHAGSLEDSVYEKPVKQPKQIPQETENYEQPLIAAPSYEQTVIDEVKAIPAVEVEPVQPEPEKVYENPHFIQTIIDEVTPSPVKAEPVKPVQPVQRVAEPIVINIVQPEPEPEPVQPKQEEPKQYVRYEEPKRYEPPKKEEKPQPKPEYKHYEEPKRYEPIKPVQPEPAPVREEQPTRVYTINTIYGGPTDEFIKKLNNEERIEFARTFIEKSNGDIGNIPEYVIGGNNKKFFSSVFIYLGRIRGLISDGLLNKMYKELNMM